MFNSRTAATAAALALGADSLPAAASAATQSSTVAVSATVTSNCTISTSPVAFGSVNTLSGSAVDASGGLSITCTNGTPWSATAGTGAGTGATFASRKMGSGSNLLNYSLYTDAGRSSVWGDGTGTTVAIGSSGTGATQSFTIYGRVPAGQTSAPAGSYADTVSVTVSY
jgi:spore coat protein U-like protein